eukprot:gene3610-3857_t
MSYTTPSKIVDQRIEIEDTDDISKSKSLTTVFNESNFTLGKFLWELFQSYRLMLAQAPIRTKSLTSATIAILGEILGSFIISRAKKEPFKIERSRFRAFALYGLLVTGPVLHFWYSLLDRTILRIGLTGHAKTVAKLIFDRLFFGPPFVLFTVIFLQFLQHFSVQKTIAYVKSSYWKVLMMNEKVWTLAQAINFELIPVPYQVLFVNAVSVGWNTLLSLVS